MTPPREDALENDSPRRATGSPRFLSHAVSSQRPRQQGTRLSLYPSGMNDDDWRAADYRPCFHVGRCSPEVRRCARVNIPCEKYCGCARVRWVGTAAPDAATGYSLSYGALVSTVGGRHVVDDAGRTPAGGSLAGPLSAFSASQSGTAPARGSHLCSRRVWCLWLPRAALRMTARALRSTESATRTLVRCVGHTYPHRLLPMADVVRGAAGTRRFSLACALGLCWASLIRTALECSLRNGRGPATL